MSEIEQLSAILGVGPESTIPEIKQAYRDLVQVWHPDRFINNPRLQQKAQERLKEINRAYNAMLASLQACRQHSPVYAHTENTDQETHQEGHRKAPNVYRRYRICAVGLLALFVLVVTQLVMPHIKGDLAEIPYNVGTMHYHYGHYNQALILHKIALWINPEGSKVYYGIGEAYSALTRFEEAEEAFRRAIELNPKFEKAYCNLGMIQASKGQYNEAAEAFGKVVQINPNNIEAKNDLRAALNKLHVNCGEINLYKNASQRSYLRGSSQ